MAALLFSYFPLGTWRDQSKTAFDCNFTAARDASGRRFLYLGRCRELPYLLYFILLYLFYLNPKMQYTSRRLTEHLTIEEAPTLHGEMMLVYINHVSISLARKHAAFV